MAETDYFKAAVKIIGIHIQATGKANNHPTLKANKKTIR